MSKLKFSANLEVLYYELPWAERFAAAKKDGFQYVEFWGWEDKDLDEVKRLVAENGLTLSAMGGDGPFSMCDPANKQEYLDYLKRAIEAAKFVGTDTLIIHSDALQPSPQYAVPLSGDYSYTTKICTMFDILSTIAPWAEEAGITFVLEALNIVTDHLGNFLTDPRTGSELTSLTGSDNMKILYDVYHMQINEGCICDTISNYADQFGHIHVADAPGRHEPGTGEINYTKVIRHLEACGYTGRVGYELFPETDTKTRSTSLPVTGSGAVPLADVLPPA